MATEEDEYSSLKIWDLDPPEVILHSLTVDVERERARQSRIRRWEGRNQIIGSLTTTELVPNSQPDPNPNPRLDRSPLYWAARKDDVDGFINVLERVVSKEKEPSLHAILGTTFSPFGNTVFHVAASYGNEATVRLIAYNFPSLLTKQNSKGDTALHIAAKAGHEVVVSTLVKLGKNVLLRIANDEGNTALHEALINRHKWVALLYLMERQVLCYLNNEKKSPLYLAAEAGYEDCLQSMLEELAANGNVHERLKGKSPVHAAVMLRNKGVLNIILEKEPRFIHLKDKEGRTPLHYAASTGYLDGVRYLLEKHTLGVMERDKKGYFPIHLASIEGHVDVIEELLQHCPDPRQLLDHNDQNILHVAAKCGKYNVITYILQTPMLEMLKNEKDKNGNTALELAKMHCHPTIVSALTCDERMDSKLINNEGLTTLKAAEYHTEREALFLLDMEEAGPRNYSSMEEKSSPEIWHINRRQNEYYISREFPDQIRSRWEGRNQRIGSLKTTKLITNSQPENPIPRLDHSPLYWAARKDDVDGFINLLQQVVSTEKNPSLHTILGTTFSPFGNTVLHVAASYGNEATVRLIAYHFPSLITKKNSKGNTALHMAAATGHRPVITTLVELQRDLLLRMTNDEGNTALHEALINCHKFAAIDLKEADPEEIYYPNYEEKSALYLAAEAGDVYCLQQLLEGKAANENVYERLRGKSPVHAAVMGRNEGLLNILLRKEPRLIGLRDEKGRTPLHCAAFIGYFYGVRYLLEKHNLGAMERDKNGYFPIHCASIEGHIDVIEELLGHCPDPRQLLNNNDQNILHVAAKCGQHNVVSYILQTPELEKLINDKDKDGNTPLHLASIHSHHKIVNALISDERVHSELINNEGLTALDAAE